MSNNFITPRGPRTVETIQRSSSLPQNKYINKGGCGVQLLTIGIALAILGAVSQLRGPNPKEAPPKKQKSNSGPVGLAVAEIPVGETPVLPEVIKRAKLPTGEDIPVQVK